MQGGVTQDKPQEESIRRRSRFPSHVASRGAPPRTRRQLVWQRRMPPERSRRVRFRTPDATAKPNHSPKAPAGTCMSASLAVEQLLLDTTHSTAMSPGDKSWRQSRQHTRHRWSNNGCEMHTPFAVSSRFEARRKRPRKVARPPPTRHACMQPGNTAIATAEEQNNQSTHPGQDKQSMNVLLTQH